jgi:hypothetical protein
LKEYDFIAKYFSEQVVMIKLLGNLKIIRGFHLNSIGELVSYKESFKVQVTTFLASTSTSRFKFSKF